MEGTTTTGAATGSTLMAAYASRPAASTAAATTTNLIDSYSNLVISSPKLTQRSRGELQLPAMACLVEKNSNQKFFVRLIKLNIMLRETIEKEAKKRRQMQAAMAAASAVCDRIGYGCCSRNRIDNGRFFLFNVIA